MLNSAARSFLTLSLLCGLAAAQANFTPLGTTGTYQTGLSHDGSATSGYFATGGCFVWTQAAGVQSIAGVGSSIKVANGGVAVCGDYVDSLTGNTHAGRWTQATGWVNLGGIGGVSGTSVSTGYDISADGKTVVGLGWASAGTANAFQWRAATGMLSLGTFSTSSRANGISADGSTPVGWDSGAGGSRRACSFLGGGSIVLVPGVGNSSEAYATNINGSAITGTFSKKAFVWTQAGGSVDLGLYPGSIQFENTIGLGVSDDGSTVVGMKAPNVVGKAWIWRANIGLVDMQTYLTGQGANVAGWDLRAATGISGDGLVIAGWGINPLGAVEGWRVVLGTAPQTYCVPKISSVACAPTIAATGSASASATSGFVVRCDQAINNKSGLLFYSVSGRAALPFQGGTLCVKAPVKRSPGTNSGGNPPPNDCSGVFQIDMNAFAAGLGGGSPLPALSVPSTVVNCQWWGRDPGFVAPNNTQLSDGLEYVVNV